MNAHAGDGALLARPTASTDLQGSGGTGVALLTTGTTLSLVRLNLPAGRRPARGRWDSTDLVASYQVPPDECGVPIAMGSLETLKTAIERGEAPPAIQQAIWRSDDGKALYLPPRL